MRRSALSALLASMLVAVAVATPSGAWAQSGEARCGHAGPERTGPVVQGESATLLFMPGPVRTPKPALTSQIARIQGFSIGLFSPTLGRYSPVQMMLDISQGARVAGSLYKPVVAPPPAFVDDGVGPGLGSGHFLQWPGLVKRAENVPGEIVPGLLACAVEGAGRRSMWLTARGDPTTSGNAAADATGRIKLFAFSSPSDLGDELIEAQHSAEFVVGAVPPGAGGLGIVRRLAAASPRRLIVLVQAPPDPARTRLLAIGVRGIGGEGSIRSATTRRDGLVVATDIAPTILDRLRIELPKEMQGRPIEGAGALTADQLQAMNARLALVSSRRAPLARDVIVLGGLILLLLLLAGRLTGRRTEVARLAQRLVALAVLWLPLMLLVTAALRPSRSMEADLVVAGSMLLALITDRLVAWPRAPFVPALVVILAHGFDFLFFGGELTGESLLGSNPLYGARFYGLGNELETVIAVSCVIGTGAALCGRASLNPARWFAAAGVVLALYLGSGRLGADVGGVIFAGAAFGAAAAYVARVRATPLRLAGVAALVLAGLAVIVLLDSITGGQSHLTRTVVDANNASDLLLVAQRRFMASINGARAGGVWMVVILALAVLVAGWLRRERLLERLGSTESRRPYRAGLAGALVGTVVGALANDSGPAILIIGTVFLTMGVLYARGRPFERVDD